MNQVRERAERSDHLALANMPAAASTNGTADSRPTASMPRAESCLSRLGNHSPKLYNPVIQQK